MNSIKKNSDIDSVIMKVKLRLLKMHYEAGVGHIGGNLSCIDILVLLYHEFITAADDFVLSKGHAAGAWYCALWSIGVLVDDDLNKFCAEGTKMAAHPIGGSIPQIKLSSGSLGHGVSIAAGLALGNKLNQTNGKVFCLTSDGEWQEGSNWEALIFSAHHKLNNLVIIIDSNKLQGYGSTRDVASLESIADKLHPFAVNVIEVDGHCSSLMREALTVEQNLPTVIVLNTVKGNGVSFMEDQFDWHYRPLSKELYEIAVDEVCSK